MLRTLVLGYGNPGRQDDGLGPAFVVAFAERPIEGVTLDSDYQLSPENAAAAADHDRVVFVDAATDGPEPFSFQALEPVEELSFSSHSLRPEAVLGLCRQCFGKRVPGWMLGIRGYSFAPFCEKLTDEASQNLAEAIRFLETWLLEDKPSPSSAPFVDME